ncbi:MULTISPECIES: septum formation initiator family protein [unclassified Yimella]|uniref:FtsB family cell division protein n=1 Tax=unclassified Yimella TaxID=2649892 RepID=UPI001459FEFB|nr:MULTISPECIES: septum formation initiator family protein [unclassified Yimella]MCG8654464.1 septum formation initiator family protein [Yimella sp. NH-Cas1]
MRERTRRRPQSMKRMTILGVLLLFLTVIITPTLNSYLQQKHQINELGAQVTQKQKDVSTKETELKKWTNDPKFVKQQARDRLGFVSPGETLTVLVDENGKPVGTVDPSGKKVSTNPWYGQVWQSTLAANRGDKK